MNAKVVAAAALALLFLLANKSEAKPPEKPLEKKLERWQFVLFLNPAIVQDDTGEAEDAIRNGISSAFAQAYGAVRDYAPSEAGDAVTVQVVFQDTPRIAIGSVFALPYSTYATVLSAVKLDEVSKST